LTVLIPRHGIGFPEGVRLIYEPLGASAHQSFRAVSSDGKPAILFQAINRAEMKSSALLHRRRKQSSLRQMISNVTAVRHLSKPFKNLIGLHAHVAGHGSTMMRRTTDLFKARERVQSL